MSNKKILIEDFVYLVNKKLDLPSIDVMQVCYQLIDKEKKVKETKYLNKEQFKRLSDYFLKQVNLNDINSLDIECYHRKIKELYENGSKMNTSRTENNKTDPHIRTVIVCK
jgi:hypothetical protein